MTDKNLDEFLYLTGQALDIKALDEREPEVVFSKAYEKKKQEVLNMVRDIDSTVEPLPKVQKNKKRRYPKTAVAAAAVVAVFSLSMGVYAAVQHFVFDGEKQGNIFNYNIVAESETDAKTVEDKIKSMVNVTVPLMKLNVGYVPEGYEVWEDGLACKKYSVGGVYGGKGISVYQAGILDGTVFYVDHTEEKQIGAMEAVLIYGQENANRLLMLDEESGVVIKILGEDVAMDELIKVAENLTMKDSGETIVMQNTDSLIVVDENYGKGVDIPKEVFVDTNHVFEWSTLVEKEVKTAGNFKVKDIQIQDNLDGLDPKLFYDYDGEISPYLDKDGKLKSYERMKEVIDDTGIRKVSEGTSQPQFVIATMEVENTTESEMEIPLNTFRISYLKGNDDKYQVLDKLDEYSVNPLMYNGEALYLDQPQYVDGENRHHYFFVDLQPGEKMTYKIGFVIYGDWADNAYLFYNPSGAEMDFEDFDVKDAGSQYLMKIK